MSDQYKSMGALSDLAVVRDTTKIVSSDPVTGLGVIEMDDFKTYVLEETTAELANHSVQLDDQSTAIAGLQSRELSFRNKIINGNFDFWQRGTSLPAQPMSTYLADRWIERAFGSSIAPSRQAFAVGQTAVPGNPMYYHRAMVSSVAGAGNNAYNEYCIERVSTFAGQAATLSFFAKADSARDIAICFRQHFGTGGAPSATVEAINPARFTLSTLWQRYTMPVVLPSIAGKTLGTNGNDSLRFDVFYDAGANFDINTLGLGQQSGTFDIAQVQLESGSVATAFEQRPLALELVLCLRYFERITSPSRLNMPLGYFFNSGAVYTPISYAQRKRAIPSVIAGPIDQFRVLVTNSASTPTSISSADVGDRGCILTIAAAGTPGAVAVLQGIDASATNAYIDVDAEL